MPEEYIGTKFNTIFLDKNPLQDPRIKHIILWGKKLSLLGLTPAYNVGAAGNLSFRTEKGFIITGAGTNLGNLKEEDFVEIRSCNLEKKEITAIGKKDPSSETMLHSAIYAKRPEVKVIFHVHDDYAVNHCEELGLRCTINEQPYGSKELVDEVLNVLDDHDYLVMKNHGIISLGSTSEGVGERIIEVNSKIKQE